mmetsp:Transcript_107133/g.189742  ORF Transcript_107133/g.189742 Transcript_107133/m.189742 type:complete len:210 (+) Transcript_107133:693-1322(+)
MSIALVTAEILRKGLLVHQGQLHAAAEEPGLLLQGQLPIGARWRDLAFWRDLLQHQALQGSLFDSSSTDELSLNINILPTTDRAQVHRGPRRELDDGPWEICCCLNDKLGVSIPRFAFDASHSPNCAHFSTRSHSQRKPGVGTRIITQTQNQFGAMAEFQCLGLHDKSCSFLTACLVAHNLKFALQPKPEARVRTDEDCVIGFQLTAKA